MLQIFISIKQREPNFLCDLCAVFVFFVVKPGRANLTKYQCITALKTEFSEKIQFLSI